LLEKHWPLISFLPRDSREIFGYFGSFFISAVLSAFPQCLALPFSLPLRPSLYHFSGIFQVLNITIPSRPKVVRVTNYFAYFNILLLFSFSPTGVDWGLTSLLGTPLTTEELLLPAYSHPDPIFPTLPSPQPPIP